MKYWEIIADKLHDAGWSLGWVPAIDLEGRTIWIVDAHGYGRRFISRADEKLAAFVELEPGIRDASYFHSIGDFLSPMSDSACYQTRLSGSICAAAHPLLTALNLATLMSSPHREPERTRLGSKKVRPAPRELL